MGFCKKSEPINESLGHEKSFIKIKTHMLKKIPANLCKCKILPLMSSIKAAAHNGKALIRITATGCLISFKGMEK
jgi:hypothetical protein